MQESDRRKRTGRVLAGVVVLGLLGAVVANLVRRDDGPELTTLSGPVSLERAIPAAPSAASPTAGASPSSAADTVGTCMRLVDEATAHAAVPQRDDAWYRTEVDNLKRRLAGTRDPELYLTQLLLDPPVDPVSFTASDQARLRDLGLRAAGSGSSLLAWHALRACAEAGKGCPYAHLEQSLLAADRQNAEAWALVATMRHQRDDARGALAAMQSAASASTSTWYWTETIALVERSLSAQTTMSYPERVLTAFGAGASTALPSQSALLKMCKVEGAADRSWAEACLAFGTLRGRRNETMLARQIAYSLNGSSPDPAELRHGELEERLKAAVIQASPSRLPAFLGAVQQFGEVEGGRRFFQQELPAFLESTGLLDRDGASACFARFLGP